MNRYSFVLAGSLVSIASARLYVGFGGSLDFSILGHELHHFYYGIGLLILAGIMSLKKLSPGLIFFIVGMGLGLITDETTLLIFIGRAYTLLLYDSPINISMDILLLIGLLRLSSAQEDRVHVSNGPEVTL